MRKPCPGPIRQPDSGLQVSARSGFLLCALTQHPAIAGDWSGDAGIEFRNFISSPLDPVQHGNNVSFYLEPEYYHDWDDDNQRFVITPFLRLDQGDPERSHFDMRELYWRKSFDAHGTLGWSEKSILGRHRIGAPGRHHQPDRCDRKYRYRRQARPADDQPDACCGIGEQSICLSCRGFASAPSAACEGRLRAPFYVDESGARYESAAGQNHVDAAVRWSHYFGDWDIGLAHFSGTSREPTFQITGAGTVVPFYDQIEQTSIDLQVTKGDWLWKLESFNRSGQGESFQALAAGFEYTLVGLLDTAIDLGIIAEYLRDNRNGLTVSNKDIATGFRLAFNDVQSTQLLAFSGIDLDNKERFVSVEGSRRLGQSWRISIEARFFSNTDPGSALSTLRDDDYLEIGLAKFF